MMVGVTASALSGVILLALLLLLVGNTRRPPALAISVHADQLVVRMRGWDVIYCCRRQVTVPVSAVDGVCVARRESVPAQGLRVPGTSIPGVIRAGSYGSGGKRDFWNVRRGEQVLVIQMRPGADEYRRLILEVPDARTEMLRLRPILGAAVVPLSPAI